MLSFLIYCIIYCRWFVPVFSLYKISVSLIEVHILSLFCQFVFLPLRNWELVLFEKRNVGCRDTIARILHHCYSSFPLADSATVFFVVSDSRVSFMNPIFPSWVALVTCVDYFADVSLWEYRVTKQDSIKL